MRSRTFSGGLNLLGGAGIGFGLIGAGLGLTILPTEVRFFAAAGLSLPFWMGLILLNVARRNKSSEAKWVDFEQQVMGLEDSPLRRLDWTEEGPRGSMAVVLNRIQERLTTTHQNLAQHQEHARVVEKSLEAMVQSGSERSLRLYRILQHTREGIAVLSPRGGCLEVNQSLADSHGSSVADMDGFAWLDLFHPSCRAELQQMWLGLGRKGRVQTEAVLVSRSGEATAVEIELIPWLSSNGRVTEIYLLMRSIAEWRKKAEQIYEQAFEDSMSGLANRIRFVERVNRGLEAQDRPSAVVLLELTNFEKMQEAFGGDRADVIAQAISRRMLSKLDDDARVYRLGSAVFGVHLLDVESPEQTLHTAQKLLEAVAQPIVLEGRQMFVSGSAGAAISTEAQNAEDLVNRAQLALQESHLKGSGHCAVYHAESTQLAAQKAEIAADLPAALESGQFELVFQPVYDLFSAQATGAEALLRWNHPKFGSLSPAWFLDEAEELGITPSIGRWVLHESCRWAAIWNHGAAGFIVQVNLSASQVLGGSLLSDVTEALSFSGLPSHLLRLDLAESMLLSQGELVRAHLQPIRDLGVQISIDNFGGGFGSMSDLNDLPANGIKLDRALIGQLGRNPETDAMILSVISQAKSLQMDVTAEGVESMDQLQQLVVIGCDQAQGFHFSRPMSAEAVTELFRPAA